MDFVKALGNGKIGGYGVVFTGPAQKDLQGDYFTPDTNLWLEHYPTVPVIYQHGMDKKMGTRVIGRATSRADPTGVWYETQLNLRDEYEQAIYSLAEAGKLGYSSGSLPHLVRRKPDGKLVSWPVAELTLTPNPAAGPYLTSVAVIKSVYEQAGLQPILLTEDLPMADEIKNDIPAPVLPVAPAEQQPKQAEQAKPAEPEGVKAMDELTISKLIDGKLESALKPYLSPVVKSGYAGKAGADAAGDAVKAFKAYLHTGAKTKALEGGTDSEGGYLIPDQFVTELVSGLTDASLIRQAGARILTVNSDRIVVPALTNSGAAVLTDEEAAYSEVDPAFTQVVFTPFKFTRTVKVSEELAADAAFDVWGQALAPDFTQAFAAAENAYLTTGTGSGQPQGVVTGAGVGKTTAGATAITADEVIDLYHSLGYLYRQNAVWMMADSTIAYIRKLKDSTGQYLWQPGMQAGHPDMILGRPVVTNNSMAAIASTAKTVLFGDFKYYWIAQRAGFSIDRNPYLYMANGQVGFFARQRVDGRVVLAEAFKVLQQKA